MFMHDQFTYYPILKHFLPRKSSAKGRATLSIRGAKVSTLQGTMLYSKVVTWTCIHDCRKWEIHAGKKWSNYMYIAMASTIDVIVPVDNCI